MTQGHENMMKQSGNAVVFVLVAIVVVAIGALAVMSGKLKTPSPAISEDTIASADTSPAEDVVKDENPVIATVDGMEIKRQEAIDMMNAMPAQLRAIPPQQLLPIAVEQLIANKVVDKKAANAGLEKDPEVLEQLAKAKEQIIRTKFLEQVADKAITDEAIAEAYKAYVENFKSVPEVKASHILVDDEKTAKDIIAKLEKGGDFAALAAEFSKDGTAANGGDLGYFAQSAVVPEFGSAAFAMNVGDFSKAPVKSDFGYHVIKLEDKRERPAEELTEVKPMLENDIRRQALDKAIMAWRDEFDVVRFDINGNPLPSAEPASGEEAVASEPVQADEAAAQEKVEAPAAE